MITLTMSVNHGDHVKAETAVAPTLEAALEAVLKTPLGIGYGPKFGDHGRVLAGLERLGFWQFGWADFEVKAGAE